MIAALGGGGLAADRSAGDSVSNGPVGLAVRTSPGCDAGIAMDSAGGAVVAVAFHGTLYNPAEFPPRWEAGPAGRLLDAYLRDGIDFLPRIRGDYALSVWDGRDRALHLAVDCFRVHPLFYYADSEKLVFGSKLQAVTACPLPFDRTLDPRAVIDLVAGSKISTPKTVYQNISKLADGQRLTYRDGLVALESYWRLDYRPADPRGEAALNRELKERFQDSIRARVGANGSPDQLGAYLSGGVDSTTVTAVLTQVTGDRVRCFSIGFEEPGFNELGFARTAAKAYGAVHNVYLVTPKDTLRAIPILLDAFDEPFGNASAVPAYYCAKFAAEQGVRTLYAGDGGDELFAGNEHYATRRLYEYYDRVPAPIRSLLLRPAALTLGRLIPWAPFLKARKYVQRASIPSPRRLGIYGFYSVVRKESLFDGGFLERAGRSYDPSEALQNRYFEAQASAELDRQLYVDLRVLIADSDLFKVTRTAEAAGIGVRFPFLDRPLAEFAARVPARLKMPGRELRRFFKRAYSDVLPPEVLRKKKHGFGLPIAIWLRNDRELRELMLDLVLSSRTIERGIFQKAGLERIVRLHQTDSTSFYGTALWNLMMLELWLRRQEEDHTGRPTWGVAAC